MTITIKNDGKQRDEQGYELDGEGQRIYPSWAGYIPPGGKPHGNARPPWVPAIANYWDATKPPEGWFQLADGSWANALNPEHVEEHPELAEMYVKWTAEQQKKAAEEPEPAPKEDDGQDIKSQVPKPEEKPPEPEGVHCKVCDRPFATPHALLIHMNHHKKTDQRHAAEVEKAEKESA